MELGLWLGVGLELELGLELRLVLVLAWELELVLDLEFDPELDSDLDLRVDSVVVVCPPPLSRAAGVTAGDAKPLEAPRSSGARPSRDTISGLAQGPRMS